MYDCLNCQKYGWKEKYHRKCYRDGPVQTVLYPVWMIEDKDGNPLPKTQRVVKGSEGSELYDSDVQTGQLLEADESIIDDIYEWMKKMDVLFPEMPSFSAFQAYLSNQICPESILDMDAVQLYRLESAVKEYGIEILTISNKMFTAFEMVRASSNAYDNEENYKREQEFKTKQMQQKN